MGCDGGKETVLVMGNGASWGGAQRKEKASLLPRLERLTGRKESP